MINGQHLREYIIRPTLEQIGLWSESAENLLMGTAAQESKQGFYLRQLKGGPAVGIFQMEPATHDDIWEHFLEYQPRLSEKIQTLTPFVEAEQMVGNLNYAAAMARMQYYRRPEPLPMANDVAALAHYWKQHYNTRLGKGTEKEFEHSYLLSIH